MSDLQRHKNKGDLGQAADANFTRHVFSWWIKQGIMRRLRPAKGKILSLKEVSMSGRIFVAEKICSCGAVLDKSTREWDNSPSIVAAAKDEVAFLKSKNFSLPAEETCPSCKGKPECMGGFPGFSWLASARI
ncbi:MAG: hypothetical protein ACD_5C00134G0008 [uncultured bacterium]|nr:MAG: hypothetical protein ACD_5C00134G0008 [uncultured bacterium]